MTYFDLTFFSEIIDNVDATFLRSTCDSRCNVKEDKLCVSFKIFVLFADLIRL